MSRRGLSRLCSGAGAILVLLYVVARLDGASASERALAQFDATRNAVAGTAAPAGPVPSLPERLAVDYSLWDPKRIREYEASFGQALEAPIAVLEIPRLALRVPVLNGTDNLRLNRGVGRVAGTAWPGQPGNMAIAGHRDGFFRGLKDVAEGDEIRLTTHGGSAAYEIRRMTIVKPTDVGVLAATETPTVTLITCYPFYFIGSAPERFIVQAELRDSRPGTSP
jgi:sortase A